MQMPKKNQYFSPFTIYLLWRYHICRWLLSYGAAIPHTIGLKKNLSTQLNGIIRFNSGKFLDNIAAVLLTFIEIVLNSVHRSIKPHTMDIFFFLLYAF